MNRHVRHLRGLQAFDVASAHSNLSRAAEEMGVTHGAVSRQIKQLEDYLGVRLLRRLPGGVEKTEVGERLHQATNRAFTILDEGIRDVRHVGDNRSLTISLSASLATKWLVPALPAFRKLHPEISVFLDTDDRIVDLQASRIDLALRYGKPGWINLKHELLAREELVVVAAPKLVAHLTLPLSPHDVSSLPHLSDEFDPAWDKWAKNNGLDPAQMGEPVIRFADSAVMIAAAIDGQGVALARRLLVRDDLRAGRLMRVDGSVTATDRALYFVCRPGNENRAPIRSFRNWLFSLQPDFL